MFDTLANHHIPRIIGVGGVAGSGKDTLANAIDTVAAERGITVTGFSFASKLRSETADILYRNFGHNVYTQDRTIKSKFRDFLTIWANMRRLETQGMYFVENTFDAIKDRYKYTADLSKHLVVITDVRFKEFEFDEVDFIKKFGTLVHISRQLNGSLIQPANSFELRNDPELFKRADHRLTWETFSKEELYDKAVEFVKNSKIL